MRVVIQRVLHASVSVNNIIRGRINNGLLVLLGVSNDDTKEDLMWLVGKIPSLRIFIDENGLMNKSLVDVSGELLVISQFTLYAATQKGNRPSYINAAKPDFANEMYELFIEEIGKKITSDVQRGEFGADMKVELLNDGPVTIIMDTKNKSIF